MFGAAPSVMPDVSVPPSFPPMLPPPLFLPPQFPSKNVNQCEVSAVLSGLPDVRMLPTPSIVGGSVPVPVKLPASAGNHAPIFFNNPYMQMPRSKCLFLFALLKIFYLSASAPHGLHLGHHPANPVRLHTAGPPPPLKTSILMGQTCANCAKGGTAMF